MYTTSLSHGTSPIFVGFTSMWERNYTEIGLLNLVDKGYE